MYNKLYIKSDIKKDELLENDPLWYRFQIVHLERDKYWSLFLINLLK